MLQQLRFFRSPHKHDEVQSSVPTALGPPRPSTRGGKQAAAAAKNGFRVSARRCEQKGPLWHHGCARGAHEEAGGPVSHREGVGTKRDPPRVTPNTAALTENRAVKLSPFR